MKREYIESLKGIETSIQREIEKLHKDLTDIQGLIARSEGIEDLNVKSRAPKGPKPGKTNKPSVGARMTKAEYYSTFEKIWSEGDNIDKPFKAAAIRKMMKEITGYNVNPAGLTRILIMAVDEGIMTKNPLKEYVWIGKVSE